MKTISSFSHWASISALFLVAWAAGSGSAAVRYVNVNSTAPAPPFTTWATAAVTIQDAVDAAVPGDEIVVTNGTYAVWGRAVVGTMTNRVAVDKPLTLRSVNGPQFTIIQGAQAPFCGKGSIRCVYLAAGASLSGFTLTNGGACGSEAQEVGCGGGLWCETNAVVSNCTVIGNSAARAGGGAYGGTLTNCTLADNWAGMGGGGASHSTLNNCTLSGNSACDGGGAYGCTLNYCIVYSDISSEGVDCVESTLNRCWTTNPLLVDPAGGNLRLQANSPCINAGCNAYVMSSTDLDGRPRIVGGTVDIGAYEFQPNVPGLFIAWLQRYSVSTDASADTTDPDAEGLNNWQEWRCATDPTDALSVLRLLAPLPGGANVTVRWQSVAGVSYFLERSTDLSATPAFTPLATNLTGEPGTTSFTDTNAAGLAPLFYRVGVGN